jgi:hypothetical protein
MCIILPLQVVRELGKGSNLQVVCELGGCKRQACHHNCVHKDRLLHSVPLLEFAAGGA